MEHVSGRGPQSMDRGSGGGESSTTPMSVIGRHRRRDGRPRRGRTVGTTLVAAVVALGAATTIVWVVDTEHHGVVAATSEQSLDTEATFWIQTNLPVDAKFLTNGHAAPPGFVDAPVDRPDQDWHAFDYLLTDPGTEAPPDAAVAQVWQSSVPVAMFPSVQVRRILKTPVDETLRNRAADRADRLTAGTALLSNPRVTASPQAQADLAAGGLDLRAAATLTALAGAMPVYVASVTEVKAEVAAGLPARAMTVQVRDAGAANAVIGGMTAAFRPDQAQGTTEGIFGLQWPLRFAPLPSVN